MARHRRDDGRARERAIPMPAGDREMVETGKTPLIEIDGIYAKLECTNPCGSIKDRIADYILAESERQGLLRPGMTVVEATSGNTGIALSYYARQRGYRVVIVMPENMTEERKRIIRHLGAELVLCSAEGSFAEAARIRDRMAEQQGYFNPDQFSNPLNVACHYETTGQEILLQIRGRATRVDTFVAGVGTGGTLIGVSRALREMWPDLRTVAVEPEESAVMSGGAPGRHAIQGIGDGFIPAIAGDGGGGLNEAIDEVQTVRTEEALETAKWINAEHGYCVGVSSGANLVAARRHAARGETTVTIFPDGYFKYRSQGLAHCRPNGCQFEHRIVNELLGLDG